MRTQDEWKVITHTPSAPSPTILSTLSRISPAALFVKVIAMIFHGLTPHSFIRYAMRCVTVLVFPDPAPAIISSGPSTCSAASRCLSFNSSSNPIKTPQKSITYISYNIPVIIPAIITAAQSNLYPMPFSLKTSLPPIIVTMQPDCFIRVITVTFESGI